MATLRKVVFLSTRAGEGVVLRFGHQGRKRGGSLEDRVGPKPEAGTVRKCLLSVRALYLADLRTDQC